MKPLPTIFALALAALPLSAQMPAVDDLKLQIHGYATQGFTYTTQNNWATTNSSDGSAAFTEAVVNLTAQPETKLRIGVQARYFLLGEYGNDIDLDWAQADYKQNEFFGFRVGKVKTPSGLFNEIQDVDPAYLWILLPQSIYPLPSRTANLAHYGGVVYGKISLSEPAGKLEYRAYAGERVIPGDDGYVQPVRDSGGSLPNGISGPTFGGSLRWALPVHGLLVGASETAGGVSGTLTVGPYAGRVSTPQFRQTYFFGRFERNRLMLAAEVSRLQFASQTQLGGLPITLLQRDQHDFYVMASWRLTAKLSSGLYYSSAIDAKLPTSSARYQKDWTLATRYDFNPFLYAKFEQHFMDGTELNYSSLDNSNLQPNTRMTLLKLGVTF